MNIEIFILGVCLGATIGMIFGGYIGMRAKQNVMEDAMETLLTDLTNSFILRVSLLKLLKKDKDRS